MKLTAFNHEYEIKPLNIITGLNGSGKTKLIKELIHQLNIITQHNYKIVYYDKPETNLHPKLISNKIKALCQAIHLGKFKSPVFIETHNDHIINGILVYCKQIHELKGESFCDKVSIYHLDSKPIAVPIVEVHHIDNTEDIDNVNFFDQFSEDLRYLTTPKRNVKEIKIFDDGKIDVQPTDFFDQAEKDITDLILPMEIPIVHNHRLRHTPENFFDQLDIDQTYIVGF